jgi:hypothetical protein
MFLGHYAVALGAKRAAPAASLGTLVAAAAFLDLVWPVLVVAGVERVVIAPGDTAFTPLDFEYYPFSHSLLMSLAWALVFGGAYFVYKRTLRSAVVISVLVASHWVLDAIVHRPDLPLVPGGTMRIGCGLWNSVTATLAVELTLFAAGLAIYLRATRALDRTGRWGFVMLAAFLLVIYAGAAFGPPPPSANAVAWSDMGQWLVILWAGWVDRHRVPSRTSSSEDSLKAEAA